MVLRLGQIRQHLGDLREVDDAGAGHVDAGQSTAPRLDLANLLRIDLSYAFDPILDAVLPDRLQACAFPRPRGQDDLPADVQRYPVLTGELHQLGSALDTGPSLDRTGLVVDP